MAKLLDMFETGFNHLTRFLIGLVAASIALFAIFIPLNLLLIKAQFGGIWWLHEAIEYALYVGVFIGAPWVLQQGAHVRVDLVSLALPAKAAVYLERLLDGIGAVLCGVLGVYGLRAALRAFEFGVLPDKDLRIDNWYMISVFSVSFFLLMIEFLLRIRRAGSIADAAASRPTKAAF